IFIRTCNTEHNPGLFVFREIDTLCPETRYTNEYFKSTFKDVMRIAGITDVIVDRVYDSAIAVYFFEGSFPFVVAFFAGHGDHRVEGSTSCETEFFCVFYSLGQMEITVYQQIARDLRFSCAKVKGYAIGFSIPISAAAVFLSGESFRSDVHTWIFSGIGLPQVENIKPNALLCRDAAFNFDIGHIPDVFPGLDMILTKLLISGSNHFR